MCPLVQLCSPGVWKCPQLSVPCAARRGAMGNVVSLSRLTEAPPAPARAVPLTTGSTWRHPWRQLERATTGICASRYMCRWNPLCRSQRPTHTRRASATHRHGTCDSANRPTCTVARACAQCWRCSVRTCQCLLRANRHITQAEPQPHGIHHDHHAQAGHSSTIGFRLGLCPCLCAGSPSRACLAKNWGHSVSGMTKKGLHAPSSFSLTTRS